MVAHTGTPARSRSIRALNEPQSVEVREGEAGQPLSVRLGRSWHLVARTDDVWRIDDEWWRERAVARLYYHVTLDDGVAMGLFNDLVSGEWSRQRV